MLGVLHPQNPGLQPQHFPAGVAQLEDVPRQAFDGEILRHRADEFARRLQDHPVLGIVGNRAATGHGGEPGALPRPEPPMDAVAVKVGSALAAPCAETLGQHSHHLVELLPAQVPIGISPAHDSIELLLAEILAGHHGDDLLGQHVQRFFRHAQAIQLAVANGVQEGDAFHQLVAAGGEQTPLRHTAREVPGTSDPLQEGRDGAGGA